MSDWYLPSEYSASPAGHTPPRPRLMPVLEAAAESQAALLGVCQDGLPLFLDLTRSTAGAFLIVSDSAEANFAALDTVLASAIELNSPENLHLHVLSAQPEDFYQYPRAPHYHLQFDPTSVDAQIALEELAQVVVHRQRQAEIFPLHVVGVEGLGVLLQHLNPTGLTALETIISAGPSVGVWLFAAAVPQELGGKAGEVAAQFPSAIFGPTTNRRFTNLAGGSLGNLLPGQQALVQTSHAQYQVLLPDRY